MLLERYYLSNFFHSHFYGRKHIHPYIPIPTTHCKRTHYTRIRISSSTSPKFPLQPPAIVTPKYCAIQRIMIFLHFIYISPFFAIFFLECWESFILLFHHHRIIYYIYRVGDIVQSGIGTDGMAWCGMALHFTQFESLYKLSTFLYEFFCYFRIFNGNGIINIYLYVSSMPKHSFYSKLILYVQLSMLYLYTIVY